MAIIEASVTKNKAGELTLSASRQGGCSGCQQSKHCALSWNPANENSPDEALALDNVALGLGLGVLSGSASDKREKKSLSFAHLKVGDTIKLECNEQNLLRYICLLFIPSLILLLVFSLMIGLYFNEKTPLFYIIVTLVASLSLGTLCSRWLLNKYASSLLKNTITPVT
ncbi:MAG: SoxR reducing system RseC family protein [Colwellia sp.]